MKKIIPLSFVIFLMLCAWAHPPKKINLSFDLEEQQLTVTAIHPVSDVKTHHIKELEIFLNDTLLEEDDYDTQTSKEALIVNLKLKNIKKGDKIVVKATCNKFGSKKQTIVVK